jgi:hypothetical protein
MEKSMSAQHVTLRQRIREWFHPAEATLRIIGHLKEEIGFKKGYEQAMQQRPAHLREPAITQAAIPQPIPLLFESPEDLEEWHIFHSGEPGETLMQMAAHTAFGICKTGSKPGEYCRLAMQILHEQEIARNPPQSRLEYTKSMPLPVIAEQKTLVSDDAWLLAPMPERVPDAIAHVDIWEEVKVLSKSGLLPALDDDDDAPTAYGRAIMLRKVEERAHKESEE